MNHRRLQILCWPSLAGALALGCAIGAEPSISASELAGRIEAGTAPTIVDVRSGSEFAESHVPGAVHVPFLDVDERAGELGVGPDETVVVYCAHGPRAAWARRSFAAAGITRVVYLEGHMSGWLDRGLPVEQGSGSSP
ncbi:MAG: rhodanese-like domain-containing protein [Myxococcota bacterium]